MNISVENLKFSQKRPKVGNNGFEMSNFESIMLLIIICDALFIFSAVKSMSLRKARKLLSCQILFVNHPESLARHSNLRLRIVGVASSIAPN